MPVYRDNDGRHWYCKFYYKDYNGQRRQKLKRGFETDEAALQYEQSFLSGNQIGTDVRFKTAYLVYLDECLHKLKPSTIRNKKKLFETKILPFFADVRIGDITPMMIREWQNSIRKENHYKGTYLHSINCQLNAMMSFVKKYYGLTVNPCELIDKMGNTDFGEMQFWTPEEYESFYRVLDEPLAEICFDMLYWTGMRVGELSALSPEDVSLETREVSINKTYSRIQGHEFVWSPKTENSVRRILLPVFLNEELAVYLRKEFHGKNDQRIFPVDSAWLGYRMKKYARIAGVKVIRCHDLRHSAASLLIHEGFDALEVSRRLGHRRPTTTMNTYAHLFPVKQEALVGRLDEIERVTRKNGTTTNVIATDDADLRTLSAHSS